MRPSWTEEMRDMDNAQYGGQESVSSLSGYCQQSCEQGLDVRRQRIESRLIRVTALSLRSHRRLRPTRTGAWMAARWRCARYDALGLFQPRDRNNAEAIPLGLQQIPDVTVRIGIGR